MRRGIQDSGREQESDSRRTAEEQQAGVRRSASLCFLPPATAFMLWASGTLESWRAGELERVLLAITVDATMVVVSETKLGACQKVQLRSPLFRTKCTRQYHISNIH